MLESFEQPTRFIESTKFEKSQIKSYEQGDNLISFWIWNQIRDEKISFSSMFL